MEEKDLLTAIKTFGVEKFAALIAKAQENEVEDWKDQLELTNRKTIKPTVKNYRIIFENHEAFKGYNLRLNDFTHNIELNGLPVTNVTAARLRNMFEEVAGIRNKDVIKDFLLDYSDRNKYNPIITYLKGLHWDGKKRVETMFIDWFNVEDTPIIRKMSEKWMVSAIKRIFVPGCNIEGMIILNGEQGMGKSTFISRLSKGFSIEACFDIKDEKKCTENCSRAWIVNFDELKSFIKADPESAKSFLTRQSDTCRLSFKEEAEEYKRHCVFIGSTNDSSILKDYTGKIERRYWIMKGYQTNKKYIYENFTDDIVDQLWAEAYNIYMKNPDYNISISDFDEKENSMLYNMQKEFKTYADDDLVESIKEILNDTYELNVNGYFRNQDDFLKQIINKNDYNAKDQLNRIPFSYLNRVISTIYHTNRPNKWIAAALEDEWFECKKGNYGNTKLHCLVRKGNKTIFDE